MLTTVTLAEAAFFGIEPERVSATLVKEAKKNLLYKMAIQVTWQYNKLEQNSYTINVLAQVQEQELFWYKLQR